MKPRLRPLDARPIQHQGRPMILLRDPLHLRESTIAIPHALGPLLALMDGTRDEAALEAALALRSGARLAPGLLSRLLADLDEACLLDNERCAAAKAQALQTYRSAPFRPMTLDGASFPPDAGGAAALLQGLVGGLDPAAEPVDASAIRGVVTPHIDYPRGGAVYAQVWRAAAQAAREAELAIVFGTDHNGSDAALTLTRQSYATPWGVLRTDADVVEALALLLGSDAAFAEELHHRDEHSIELASVWLQFVRGGEPLPLVPVLCGSFSGFVAGEGDPAQHAPFEAMLDLLSQVCARRRTLVVAAADLAHMGPAFGDPYGLDFVGRARLRAADERLLAAVLAGDARGFFEQIRSEADRRHVCGLPPVYLALRLLQDGRGEAAGYAICPADMQGTSFVSVAGVVLR